MMTNTMLTSDNASEKESYIPIIINLHLAMMTAIIMAIIWWLVTLWIRELSILNVWTDQIDKFTTASSSFFTPYQNMSGFFSPPWAVIPLAPFEWVPLPIATLIQSLIYFSLLAIIAHRYEMSRVGWLVVLSSPLALDAIIELNIDWIAAIGLVLPVQFSFIFLAVKPQAFPGYVFTLSRQQFVRAIIILLITILVSFVIWGNWLEALINEFGTRTLALGASVSPWAFLPAPVSILIGILLLIYAFRKNDDVLKILSGVFFTPYLPTYTAIIPFLFFCVRFPRIGAYISFALWLIALFILRPTLMSIF